MQNNQPNKRRFLPYNEKLKNKSRDLRNNSTNGEIKIWNDLLKKKQTGFLFNRQKIINNFIADFYSAELKLIIEIDGISHDTKTEYDEKRTRHLSALGLKVIRFFNKEVMENINGVRLQLLSEIKIRCEELNIELRKDIWDDV